jgi:hypothetical protein
MQEPLFCKKAVSAPSAKNSYMAGGTTIADVGAHGDAPLQNAHLVTVGCWWKTVTRPRGYHLCSLTIGIIFSANSAFSAVKTLDFILWENILHDH